MRTFPSLLLWALLVRSPGALAGPEQIGLCGYRAVLFGAQDYADPQIADLQTPNNDIEALAQILESRFGFDVQRHPDASRRRILDTLDALRGSVTDCEAVLVYFAGHGVYDEAMERGFWLPTDTVSGSRANWISSDDVASRIKALGARHVLLIADSCFSGALFRDVGDAAQAPGATDLAAVRRLTERRSRWVLTSGAGDEVVRDQYRQTGMSVFAYFLHQQLAQAPGRYLVLDAFFAELRELVAANAQQTPQQGAFFDTGHEGGQLVLSRAEAGPGAPRDAAGAEPPPGIVALRPGEIWVSQLGIELVWVPGGTFVMGSPQDERGRLDEESQHPVTVRGLSVMRSEVTQGLWQQIMGTNPSHFGDCGADCPVEEVAWTDAVRFANAVSEAEGLQPAYRIRGDSVDWDRTADGYRLLTEAEWEHAARGGEQHHHAGSDVPQEVGWIHGRGGPHPVCTKQANGYRLCDMTGNVWEWVWDWYGPYPEGARFDPRGPTSGSMRVVRGGSWGARARYARVAVRSRAAPARHNHSLGLRLARPGP